MNFNFKRIASVASSALMIGSTVALAAAANYPAPFVSGSNADVAIVYGSSSAAAVDLVGAIEISNSLQGQLGSNPGSPSAPTSGEDFVELAKSSDRINLRDNVATVFGSTVDDDDLGLLADGVYRNDESTEYDYEQRVALGSGLILNFFSETDFMDEAPTIGINLTANQNVLNYTLDFTTDAESDVSGGDLVDIETTTISMLGRDYYVLDADNATGDLTLLDAASSATLNEGETKTLTIGGRSYSVRAPFIGTNNVRLEVNGQTTNTLDEGETEKLADGTYVGIKDILVQDFQGGTRQVEFSLGSGKLELQNGSTIELNDEDVEQVTSTIFKGTPSGGKEKIDKIRLTWTTDDEEFIAADSDLVLPGFENLKLSMDAFMMPAEEVTVVERGGDEYVQLTTTIKDGQVSIPLLYANESGEFVGIGKDANNKLLTVANGVGTANSFIFNDTRGDEWLVASWNTSSEAESYLLSFTWTTQDSIDKISVQRDTGDGEESVCDDKQSGDTCDIGSLTLTFHNVDRNGADRIVNISGNAGSSFNTLYTETGLKVFLPVNVSTTSTSLGSPGAINLTGGIGGPTGADPDSFRLVFVEENKDDDIAAGSQFNVTLNDNSDGEVEASAIATGRSTINDPEDNDHQISYVYSDVATMVERIGDSSDSREAQITYSGSESYAKVFLSAPESSRSGGNSTSGGSLGSITVKDNEVAQVSGKNLIVLGGSCVNTVAASLLGSDRPLCGADFTTKTGAGAGQFVIQSFASPYASSKIAVLVAGYEADDTKNAATYLRTQSVDTSSGKKYIGTSATSATLVTTNSS